MDQPSAGSGHQLAGQQPMASKATSSDVYDGPPQQAAQFGTGMRPGGGDGGDVGMGPSSGGSGMSSGGLGPGSGQQSSRSPSKRRQPMSIAPSDVREFHIHLNNTLSICVVCVCDIA